MSVLNGEAFLRPAVDSVLGQTFRDFEFIVIDNASTDGTAAILDSYRDERMVRLRNDEVRSLTQSLNRGLAVARGEFVARQDADDVLRPSRLARQVAYLESHPDVLLVATHVRFIDQHDKVIGDFKPGTDPADLYDKLAYSNPFYHSTIMFRRAAIDALGGYDTRFTFAQDLALWLKLARRGRLGMVEEVLVDVREHTGRATYHPAIAQIRHRESITIFETAQLLPGLSRRARRLGRDNLARLHCLLAGALLASGEVAPALLELARGLYLAPLFCLRRALAGRYRTVLPARSGPAE
jgi:glycosyltransferase involved in cell wall biosynthesis